MDTKELLQILTECLKTKYSAAGITAAEQIDGCMSSAISFAISDKEETRTFNIVLTETQKKFV